MTVLLMTFDLDSTMYKTEGRDKHIDRSKGTDWVAYSMLCRHDVIDPGVFALAKAAHAAGIQVHYVTGRMAAAREETLAKFEEDGVPCDGLWMDESTEGDHISNYGSHALYKVARIQEVIEHVGGEHVLHIDDYSSVKIELEKVGIACIAVKTPNEILLTARRQS